MNHLLARRERHVSFSHFAWAKKLLTSNAATHACEAGGLWLRRCPWAVGRPWRAIALRQTDVLLTQPGGRPESFRHRVRYSHRLSVFRGPPGKPTIDLQKGNVDDVNPDLQKGNLDGVIYKVGNLVSNSAFEPFFHTLCFRPALCWFNPKGGHLITRLY